MPPKDPAEYMRNYRARKAERQEDAPDDQALVKEGEKIAVGHPEKRDTRVARVEPPIIRSQRVDPSTGEIIQKQSGYRMLPGDDWVQKLTQHQRDEILNHPAIKTSKRA